MLTVSGLAALLLTELVALPVPQAVISVFLLGITPDIHEGLRKGELRLLGAILALAWGALTFFIVGHLPYFLVFMGVLFFGMLLAAYLARASTTYSYAGLQMGLVLPMVAVAPLNEFGSVAAVVARIEGVLSAALCHAVRRRDLAAVLPIGSTSACPRSKIIEQGKEAVRTGLGDAVERVIVLGIDGDGIAAHAGRAAARSRRR